MKITSCLALAGLLLALPAVPLPPIPVVPGVQPNEAHAAKRPGIPVRPRPGKPGAGSDSVEAKASSRAAEQPGPIGVFADIEDGWRSGSVQEILRHFGRGKVAISIEGIGPTSGSFSKSQSHYLFKDLFKYTITERFEFVQYRNVSDGRAKVYAVAERSFKRNDDGRLIKDKIYVSLHVEDDRWVITEIKSVR